MLAKALANLARNHSMDSNFDSPYSMEARAKVKLSKSINANIQIHLLSEDSNFMP